MTNKIPTKGKFLKNLHDEFPTLEKFREHELKKVAHAILNRSTLGRVSSIIYFIIGFGSIFVYWRAFDLNIFLSIFLGIAAWFAVTTVVDKMFIKFLGIERVVKHTSEENLGTSLEELKKKGLLR